MWTPYPGSSIPLANCVPAFTSPTRSWVMGHPGYGSGAGRFIGNKVVQVPLRKDYSHDVEAMIKADPNAGAYYICNPNNPTGTLTPRKDFEYILANKKKDAVLVIDEAYVHFRRPRESCRPTWCRQDKDVVVLRTFSKIYGMAGLRAGALYGRPDLLAKVAEFGSDGHLPVTATACAAASMKVGPSLMKERLAINKRNRDLAFEHIEKVGVAYIPSTSNFFMMSVKGMTGADSRRGDGGKENPARRQSVAGVAGAYPRHRRHLRRDGQVQCGARSGDQGRAGQGVVRLCQDCRASSAPQWNPAPNAAKQTVSPVCSCVLSRHSAAAISRDADDVLP